MLKNLNKEQVCAQYSQSDVYVLAGTREAASITMIEAMAFSVPAISGSDNGTASYIEEGINGYVFEDNNLEDLKKKLEMIVCDKENIPKMGKAGYQHVLDHFQFKNYFNVVEEIRSKMSAQKR